mgnify:CR=1 FL=1
MPARRMAADDRRGAGAVAVQVDRRPRLIDDPAFAAGVHKALGIELPGALSVIVKGDTSLQWMGPDEWLLIVPSGEEFAAEQQLREALGDLHIASRTAAKCQAIIASVHAKAAMKVPGVFAAHAVDAMNPAAVAALIRQTGLRCTVHAENTPILNWRGAQLKAAGRDCIVR